MVPMQFWPNILKSTMNSKLLIMVLNRPPLSMWPIYAVTFLDVLFTSCLICLLEPITVMLMTNCLSVLLFWKDCLLNHSMLLSFLPPLVHWCPTPFRKILFQGSSHLNSVTTKSLSRCHSTNNGSCLKSCLFSNFVISFLLLFNIVSIVVVLNFSYFPAFQFL